MRGDSIEGNQWIHYYEKGNCKNREGDTLTGIGGRRGQNEREGGGINNIEDV